MAIINTASLKRSLMPGVRAWVGAAYDAYGPEHLEIFEKKRSNRAYEIEVTLAQSGLFTVKGEGESVRYDDFMQGFTKTYTPVVYGSGFVVTREHIEDNQYVEVAQARAAMLGRSAAITKETIGASVLNLAFDTTVTMADGLCLVNASHKLEKGGTFSNKAAVDSDLSELSLEQACIDIMAFKDGAGKLIKVMPRKLIVSTADAFNAERILKSTLQNDTANNALNALRSKGMLPDGYTVNHYLVAGNGAWFVKTDVPNGLTLYQNRELEINNDEDFDSENMKFKATERYVFGCTDVRGVYGTPGA